MPSCFRYRCRSSSLGVIYPRDEGYATQTNTINYWSPWSRSQYFAHCPFRISTGFESQLQQATKHVVSWVPPTSFFNLIRPHLSLKWFPFFCSNDENIPQLLLLCPKRARKPVLLTAAALNYNGSICECISSVRLWGVTLTQLNAFEKTRICGKYTGDGDIPSVVTEVQQSVVRVRHCFRFVDAHAAGGDSLSAWHS